MHPFPFCDGFWDLPTEDEFLLLAVVPPQPLPRLGGFGLSGRSTVLPLPRGLPLQETSASPQADCPDLQGDFVDFPPPGPPHFPRVPGVTPPGILSLGLIPQAFRSSSPAPGVSPPPNNEASQQMTCRRIASELVFTRQCEPRRTNVLTRGLTAFGSLLPVALALFLQEDAAHLNVHLCLRNIMVRYGIIGAGAVSDYHHVPGIKIDPRAELVAICDPNEELLNQRKTDWGVNHLTTDYRELVADPDIDAVIIATPNFTHKEMAIAAANAGKHIMCEKPLALNHQDSAEMHRAARDNNVKHMTAFTYRFAPSMRYLRHLLKTGALGEPRHFRSQRFLDWPETSWGWRQYQDKAGAGDLFDMTIHRIDFAMDLLGPIQSVCGAVETFCPRDKTVDGLSCPPSNVDDWSSMIGRFACGAVGVWEGTTVAKGHHNDGFGWEWAEINGSEASAVYKLTEPNTILMGKHGESLENVPVPDEFLVIDGSPRDPTEGVPSTVFRYDLVYELTSAIKEDRPAIPGFDHGTLAQAVADAVLESNRERKWIDLDLQLD